MAQTIYLLDGFDEEGAGNFPAEGWNSSGTSFAFAAVSGRVAGSAMRITATTTPTIWQNVTGDAHPHVAMGWKTSDASQSFTVCEFKEGGGTVHGRLVYNGNGTFTLSRAGSIPATSANLGVTSDVWYHLELDYYIHDTNGRWEFRFNKVAVIGPTTSLDTRNGGTSGVCDNFAFFGPTSTTRFTYFDDMVYATGAGNADGTWYGDCRVITQLPTSDGSSSQWTPSTGSNHFAVVDESTPNDDTDYLSESVSGDRELFGFPSLGVTGTVKAVAVHAWSRKTDTGTISLALTVRQSSTNYDHATTVAQALNYAPDGNKDGGVGIWETNPAGGSWTVADVNSGEYGIKVA